MYDEKKVVVESHYLCRFIISPYSRDEMSAFNQHYGGGCAGHCMQRQPRINVDPANYNPFHNAHDDMLDTDESDKQVKQEMDDLLSQAMKQLTFEERQKQLEVLHGVHDDIVEDPNSMDRALKDLEAHLEATKHGTKYELAESMNRDYVSARPFRMMFLRANEYDGKASADQMLRFFDFKHKLFGSEKLAKDITMEDLDDDDIACLKTGWIQPVGRDTSRRQMFAHFAGLKNSKSLLNDLREHYFVKMKSLQSEHAQLQGFVSVWYGIGDLRMQSSTGLVENFILARAIPQKIVAIHLCVDNLRQYAFCSAMLKVSVLMPIVLHTTIP